MSVVIEAQNEKHRYEMQAKVCRKHANFLSIVIEALFRNRSVAR